jgi:hypothetical protein
LHIFPQSATTFRGIPLKDSYQQCFQLIHQLVHDTLPDVICLTGDIIDGRGPWQGGSQAVTEALVDLIPHFQGTPWIYLPGNHEDDGSPWQRSDLLQILKLPGCLQSCATSFHHTLLLQKTTTMTPKGHVHQHRVRLHIFDSGGNHPDPKVIYECTPRRTVESFYQFCTTINTMDDNDNHHSNNIPTSNDTVSTWEPELVYLHIPTPEYQHLDPIVGQNNLFHAALVGGKVPPMLAKLAWLIRLCKLDRIAGCRRDKNDSGLFPICVQVNDYYNNNHKQQEQRQRPRKKIVAMFCGHDHHSDAVYQRQGIFLGYGRSGSYTPPFDWEGKAPNTLLPGGRVVEINAEDESVVTWIQTGTGPETNTYLDMVRLVFFVCV